MWDYQTWYIYILYTKNGLTLKQVSKDNTLFKKKEENTMKSEMENEEVSKYNCKTCCTIDKPDSSRQTPKVFLAPYLSPNGPRII